jgi:hypothetical protein
VFAVEDALLLLWAFACSLEEAMTQSSENNAAANLFSMFPPICWAVTGLARRTDVDRRGVYHLIKNGQGFLTTLRM